MRKARIAAGSVAISIIFLLLLQAAAAAQGKAAPAEIPEEQIGISEGPPEISEAAINESPIGINEGPIGMLATQAVGKKLPGPLGTLFGNAQMNLYITRADSTVQIASVVIKNKTVETFEFKERDDAGINVYSSEETVQGILGAEDPLQAFQSAVKEKKITYAASGIKNKIKLAFFSPLVKLAGLFGGKK